MKYICVKLIEFYQKYISAGLVSHCKYQPTCSEYAKKAIIEHGFFIGILLGIYRILRCNPFSKGGYDPVPPNRRKIKWVL